jgi:hypothetical protein
MFILIFFFYCSVRNDPIEIEDNFIDLTKWVNDDEIIISDDDYTIIINEEMECKR